MTDKKLSQKKAYITGYIKHLNNQIKEYGKNTSGLEKKAKIQIKAFEDCLKSTSCAGCVMSKTCGYGPNS